MPTESSSARLEADPAVHARRALLAGGAWPHAQGVRDPLDRAAQTHRLVHEKSRQSHAMTRLFDAFRLVAVSVWQSHALTRRSGTNTSHGGSGAQGTRPAQGSSSGLRAGVLLLMTRQRRRVCLPNRCGPAEAPGPRASRRAGARRGEASTAASTADRRRLALRVDGDLRLDLSTERRAVQLGRRHELRRHLRRLRERRPVGTQLPYPRLLTARGPVRRRAALQPDRGC
jgi:hypothetical protein